MGAFHSGAQGAALAGLVAKCCRGLRSFRNESGGDWRSGLDLGCCDAVDLGPGFS
jgi:hypothetical protein